MYLRQSTAYTFRHGPFLDDTDGKTAETGLTISQADVRISKAGGNFAQKFNSTSSAHDEIGFYAVELGTIDTNTCGELLVVVHETGALPVFKTFQVVEEAIYDSLYAASAAAFDANQRVDVSQIEGSDATDQINAACDTALSDYDGPTKAEMDTGHALLATEAKQDIIDGNVDQIETAVITNASGVDIAADIIALKAETVLIVADTNELQGDDIPASLSTISGKVDVVDAIVDSILVDTAVIGSAGSGLTDLGGMSTAMKAEVNTEVDTALSDYDGPTKAEMDTGHALLATEAKQDIIDGVVDSTLADTNELQTDDVPGLIAALNNISAAQVNTQVDNAMVTYGLDHLVSVSVAGSDITDNSIVAKLVSKESTADWDDFVNTTDSLQAIADAESSPPTAAVIADAVWDETQSSHTTSGSFGEIAIEIASTLADSNELQTDDVPGLIAALNNISTAQVNSQVDTALSDYDGPTKTEIDSAFTEIKGASWSSSTDTLEAIRNRGDASWVTATGFNTTTPPTAAAIVNEWESQSQADPTGFWCNVKEVNGTAQSANDNSADINAILTDTGTTLPATLATIDGVADSILVDTGTTIPSTLSTISGKVDTVDGIVDSILTDTAEIGTAGAGLTEAGGTGDQLTAITWNSSWDAEVQSECADAITAYDPPTKAEMDTANGLLATEAKQDTQKAETVLILADTNELQADDIPGTLSTISGKIDTVDDLLDTEVAAIKSDTAAIKSDTAAILVDTGTTLPATLSTISGKTSKMVFSTTNQLDTQVLTMATNCITADAAAADFIGASEIAASASQAIADLISADWVAGDGSPLAIVAALKADAEWSSLAAIDLNISQIETAVITNASGVDIAADIIAIKAQTVAIEADTTGLAGAAMRGTDSAATAAELAKVPKSDSTVSWNATALAAINAEADTALSDYDGPTKSEIDSAHSTTDGKIDAVDNFVDTEISGIKSVVDDILVDTAEIGTAGVGLTEAGATGNHLTDIPWNSSWDAEVQSECTDAIVAYDGPTKAEIDSAFTEIKGASWSSSTDTLEAIRDRGDAAWITATGFNTTTPPTAAVIADAVWDEAQSGHTSAGTFGETAVEIANILVDTSEIGVAGAGLTEAGGTGDQLTAIIWNSAWDAEVQSECADALNAYDPPTKAEIDSAHSTTDALIATIDSNIDSILTDTAEIGVAGAGLTEAGGTGDQLTAVATAAALAIVDGVADSILVDTGTTLPATLATIDGVADSILVDTGTSLPASLSSILTDTGTTLPATLSSILTDTAEIGTAGAGLTALANRPAKNTELANFTVYMVENDDHVTPKTLATVSAQRSIDGATFEDCANSVSEVQLGLYKITLAASDMNGDVITLRFTATSTDTRVITIVTQG